MPAVRIGLGVGVGVTVFGGGVSSGGPPPAPTDVFGMVPTPAPDGVTTVFNLSPTFIAGTTNVYLNGARQSPTDDYSETGTSQITFVSAPAADAIIVVDYTTP